MTAIENYVDSIMKQRKAREEKMLASPLNWLSLVGLFRLKNGENSIGNGSQYHINLPALPAEAHAIFHVREDGVYLSALGTFFRVNGLSPTDAPLRQDVDGDPDLVEAGSIAIRVIQRNNRLYLRVWDREAPAVKDYKGLRYFLVDPKYRITAAYQRFETPRSILIMDAIGGEQETLFPGQACFSFEGAACTLIAEEDDDGLLFNFTDLTRADTTYPGGRYLLAEQPHEGTVLLDFNLTRNWPCAYTAFATCPLPPTENHLKVRIEAGEMRYHDQSNSL